MKRILKIFSLLILAFILSNCSQYQKILKSTDYELKYEKALEYFNNYDVARADDLFYELIPVFKGTAKGPSTLYYFATCQFALGDYLYAGSYYRNFVDDFSTNQYAEECMFMVAYCFYLDAPNPRLDQTSSYDAISHFQRFLNQYPDTKKKELCNKYIDELTNKLVEKSYLNSKLYYDMGRNFKASIISLENTLNVFPFTIHREDLMFMLLKSYYEYGQNSIKGKKIDRLQRAVEEYYSFVGEFPNSEYRDEATRIFNTIKENIN